MDQRVRQIVSSRMDEFCEGVVAELRSSFPR